jgi:2-polyprenyl-3-methyl-5-hydroxy-6-metoxy-1,4-benzoquinol methylase
MNCLISPHYIEQNASLHETNEFYGTTSFRRVGDILSVANAISARSILDYGCGKALLHNELQARCEEFNQTCTIENYDPAMPEFATPPSPAHLVVCTDVMEHVEPEFLDNVLADLKRLTLHTLYLAISTRKSAKTLPDGRNTHLIVKPADWWLPKLRKDWTPWRTNWNENELVTVLRPR